jgi:hypothetical protein
MSKSQDVYKEVRVFEYPNMVVRVHIPDITDEENERRMKAVRRAAEALLKEGIENSVSHR